MVVDVQTCEFNNAIKRSAHFAAGILQFKRSIFGPVSDCPLRDPCASPLQYALIHESMMLLLKLIRPAILFIRLNHDSFDNINQNYHNISPDKIILSAFGWEFEHFLFLISRTSLVLLRGFGGVQARIMHGAAASSSSLPRPRSSFYSSEESLEIEISHHKKMKTEPKLYSIRSNLRIASTNSVLSS